MKTGNLRAGYKGEVGNSWIQFLGKVMNNQHSTSRILLVEELLRLFKLAFNSTAKVGEVQIDQVLLK